MPDKKMEAVLLMLSEQVGYSYKVVKKQMLAESLPKKFALNVDELVAVVAFLKERDYVAVKYQDKDEICLALTVKAENFLSSKTRVTEQSNFSGRELRLLFLGVFAASFLGALAAIFLAKLF